MKLMNRFPNK